MGKRILLFLAVNFLVIITISLVLSFFNIQPYLTAYGINYQALLIFCLIWGMGGAFITLALSKTLAKWMMGVKIIDPATTNAEERLILETVNKLIKDAHLTVMPEVGIYSSNEVNAFATGPSKKNSLIAISSGLLNRMDQNELEGVLGHEISHIANGDMVTMTLIQGIINAFVMFLARIMAYIISSIGKSRDQSPSYGSYHLFVILFQIAFMILGSLVVAAFSRYREFRADRGSAKIVGKDKMIEALNSLRVLQEIRDVKKENPSFHALKIATPPKKRLIRLFATHPPIQERIERLKKLG